MRDSRRSLAEELWALLLREEKFHLNGSLNLVAVRDACRGNDPRLLELLLGDPEISERFFTRVGSVAVFDKGKFLQILERGQGNRDGYTLFKNKIGLSFDAITPKIPNHVVLVWPYKDSVLEGGQTKEDRSRKERFLHTEVDANEIDRLFEPKALVNWKRWDADGCKAAETVSRTDNILIRGNNLIALHSLAASHRGAVKLIYIDPPYNTGSDAFLYNDRFGHSTWLTFMKNRLEIARELLREDGAIFIQVDDSEFAYLKVLCDEVFGRDNFREAIVLKSGTESGVNAINVKRGERLFKVKEYILFYSKTPAFRFKPFYTRAPYNLNYKYRLRKTKGGYEVMDLLKKFKKDAAAKGGSAAERNQRAGKALEKYALAHPEEMYSLEKNIKKAGAKFKAFAASTVGTGRVEFYVNSAGVRTPVYDGGTLVSLAERVIEDDKGRGFGVLASDLWTDIGTTPSREGGVKFSNGKKPEKLLHRILEMGSEPGDLVLDYHLGSGTTAAVAHKTNRRYIGIEQMDYGENDATLRLLGVVRGEATGISKRVNWKGGGTFLTCELAKQNASYMKAITSASDRETLVSLYASLVERGDQRYELDGKILRKYAKDFEALDLDDMRRALAEMIEFNDFYVSRAQMDDPDSGISDVDRRLTDEFYS